MRDTSIDLLRFIGLAMVILAHVGPPELLHQIRNFDVPLMVLVSGVAFSLSYKSDENYRQYLLKRMTRLLMPVWIFLTLYFLMQLIFLPDSHMLSPANLLAAYTLTGGMGYVWIIRVFLFVALLAPFIYFLHLKIASHKKYFSLVFLAFFLCELLRFYSLPFIQVGVGQLLGGIVLYAFSYSLVFAVGIRLLEMNRREIKSLAAIFLTLFLSIGLVFWIDNNGFVATQYYKYPPSMYYFSYALFVSLLLFYCRHRLAESLKNTLLELPLLFISRNSIWIYLWHIPLAQLLPKIVEDNFLLLYGLVFSIAVIVVFFQVFFVERILAHCVSNAVLNRNIKAVLTG